MGAAPRCTGATGAGGEGVPLVILPNAANHQIHRDVAKLEAPFHAVFTAKQA